MPRLLHCKRKLSVSAVLLPFATQFTAAVQNLGVWLYICRIEGFRASPE